MTERCKTCRIDLTNRPHVFRQGWWYCVPHAPQTDPAPHGESYIDDEGEERCSTCDKWLEPGYYDIDDHRKSVLRDESVTPDASA